MASIIILLLLHSQLYISGVHLYLVRFLCMWPFFDNPTNEVVTFCLHGWYMLGVFFFGASIHPSMKSISGSFESMRWNACVHGLDVGLYSHLKEFLGNRVRTNVNCKGKIRSTGNSEEDQTCDAASRWIASPIHYRLSYSGSPIIIHYKCERNWSANVQTQANTKFFWQNHRSRVLSLKYGLDKKKWIWGLSDQQVSTPYQIQFKPN